MKKFGKMNLIFEFSASKLGYMAIFKKILEKKFDTFFMTSSIYRGKNENKKIKKLEKMSLIFELSISKLGLYVRH